MDRSQSSLLSRTRAFAILVLGVFANACAAGHTTGEAADEVVDRQTEGAAFLDDARVADLVTIAPTFPFGVTKRHAAAGPVLGARWGNHGGPLVTTRNFSAPASPLKVSRWTAPVGATDAANRTELASILAPNLPPSRFWGVDGFVDLPVGPFSMLAYSGSGEPFPGEVLFYTKDYDRVVARANVNGFYSGIGVTDGRTRRLVYSGLSGLRSAPTSDKDSALYASDVCNDSPVPSGSCAATVKLFGWSGSSGPIAADADGNVFVGAFVSGGAHSDAIYGVTRSQTFATAAVPKTTVAEADAGGTASLAAITKPGSNKGWVVAKGHDGEKASPAYARAYRSTGGAIVADGATVENAIAGTSPDASLSFFSDPAGLLWVAVELPDASWLLQLAPRP
jgi:hypothetical protein